MAIETPARQEIPPSPELPNFSKYAALYPRLLVGGDYLNPDKTDLAEVTILQLGDFETRDYGRFEQLSQAERKASWEGKGDFNSQKQIWVQETVKKIQEGKDFFTNTKKGQNWQEAFQKIGLNIQDFSDENLKLQAEKLFNKYLDTSSIEANIKRFVEDIIRSHTSQDLKAFEWLSNIFGANSSKVVTRLIEAETLLKVDPDTLINNANTQDNQSILRINNIDKDGEERKILDFLYAGKPFIEIGSPKPTTPIPLIPQPDTPTAETPTQEQKSEETSEKPKDLEKPTAEISLDRARKIMENAIVYGNPKDAFKTTAHLPEEILKKDNTHEVPKYKLEFGETTVYLPEVIVTPTDTERAFAYGFVEYKGITYLRVFYRSNSQGEWRLLPAYDNQNHWLVKGHSELSLHLSLKLQKELDRIAKINPVIGFHSADVKKFALQTPDVYNKGYAAFGPVAEKELTAHVEKEGLKLDGNFYKTKADPLPKPETVTFNNPGHSPDFAKPITSWETSNDLYGNVTVEAFPSKDGKIIYSFYKDKRGRVWIGGAEVLDSELTQSGVKKQWVNLGILATPAYEYDQYSGGYGNQNDKKLGYVDMFTNYLSKIPVIEEYLNRPLAKAA